MATDIPRQEFIGIMDAATVGITPSTRSKLMAVARGTQAVAVGWFHCNGVMCPARQAGRHNQTFQLAFDRAMTERFHTPDPFVVVVIDPKDS